MGGTFERSSNPKLRGPTQLKNTSEANVKITIDNMDGAGARDYTAALSADAPFEIVRARDEAARCAGLLDVNAAALPAPARHARVVVANDSGVTLFTGSIVTQPERVYAGVATTGAVYRLAFRAIADAADATGVAPLATHALGDGDAALHIAPLSQAMTRELATDVTLTGETEAAAYITEYFMGDGTTSIFQLTQPPYRAKGPATLLDERFDQAAINPRVWSVADNGSFLSLTHLGLTMTGGNGLDGQTTLSSVASVEIGGTLTLELDSVALGAASDGVVCGLYTGAVERANCFAGFNVRQSGGATIVTPFVNGVEAGTSLTMLSGHSYTLRLRLHCTETVRSTETYSAVCDGVLRSFGGDAIAAPVTLVFESRDMGTASNTPATVLYTTALASSPASCTFAPVNSVQLQGSIGSCGIAHAGPAWIATTVPGSATIVRVSGPQIDGVDCMVSPSGRITFYAGRVPVANETIAVSYRGRRRAAARLRAGSNTGVATAAWQGKVTHPPSRTTADCENAVLAAMSLATSRAVAVQGSCTMVNPAQDVQPGDVLSVASGSGASADTLNLCVRSVVIEDGHARPEAMTYRVGFANDWTTALSARLADGVAADALQQVALTAPATVLANLAGLQVVSATGTALQVDAGVVPPTGGGFEVRRRDWAFGPGTGGDLVLRSPVRSFTIPRSAQVERFFVRMYDGSSTPVYSRLSSAVFTNLPVGS
ncbi:MAG: hypothetical protein JST61_11320 [Acidobacteria bacterium]|nr:hypothetical protein [Acidobacteriota bacterium]